MMKIETIQTGWSEQIVGHSKKHLGFGLNFASEPVWYEMKLQKISLKERKLTAL